MRVTALGLLPLIGLAAWLPLEKLGVATELVEGYPILVRLTLGCLALVLLLLALLIELLYHHYREKNDRSDFVEWDGAYLKKKKEGGLHECVYCYECYCSTAAEYRQDSEKLKCKCGWMSHFSQGDFRYHFEELVKKHGAEPVE